MKHLIIDTREPSEFASSHIDGALNIPSGQFAQAELPDAVQSVAKDEPIIVYCRSGQRSNMVAQALGAHGFTNITNGINESQVRMLLAKSHE